MSQYTHSAIPIMTAVVAAWIFGAIYYGLFGRTWIEAQGKTIEQGKAEGVARSTPVKIAPFILSFVAETVMGSILSGVMFHVNIYGVRAGAFSGFMCWLGFVLTTVAVNNAYAFRRLSLTAIDAGHWLGVLVIMGGILGWFGR